MSVIKGNTSPSKKVTKPKRAPRPVDFKGENKFVPTEDMRTMVSLMLGAAAPHERIRMLIINPLTAKPISINTFKEAFAAEIEIGDSKLEAMLLGSLAKKAQGNSQGAVTAAIFLLKAKFSYRDRTEKVDVEASMPKGGKMKVTMKMEG